MKMCQPNSPPNFEELPSSVSMHQHDLSADDSNHDGGPNDPKAWFHDFNQNPSANLQSNDMDGKLGPHSRIRYEHPPI